MKSIIFSYLIFFSLFFLIISQVCNSESYELNTDYSKIPLINGRCCKHKEDTTNYEFIPDIKSLFDIQNQKLECNTYVEKCYNMNLDDDILNITKCTEIETEVPFKCCHVKYKSQAGCFPLDIHKKKYFGWYKTFFRAKYGLFDAEEIKINCNSIYNNLSFLIILIFFSLIC